MKNIYAIKGSEIQKAMQLKTCIMVLTEDGKLHAVPTDPANADFQTLQGWLADGTDGGSATVITSVAKVGADYMGGLTITLQGGQVINAPGDHDDVNFQLGLIWLNDGNEAGE